MKYRLPTVMEYLVLKYSENTADVVAVAKNITELNSMEEFQGFLTEYLTEIETERAENPQLQTPYYPKEDEQEHYYNCNSTDIKLVSDYTRLNFCQIHELDIFTFWAWLHDAVVWDCNKSEDGRDYLEKCWTNSQTEPDRTALREIFR